MLANTQETIDQIVYLTGFSEPSVVSHVHLNGGPMKLQVLDPDRRKQKQIQIDSKGNWSTAY